jgi:hypothetical protein
MKAKSSANRNKVKHEISTVSQWKRTYLPKLSASERLDTVMLDGNHVGALLASRVLSAENKRAKD